MEPLTAASSAAGPPVVGPPIEDRRTRIARYVFLFLIPFLMVTMMYATYVGTMHAPHPRDMPVAVVGVGAQAEAVVDSLAAVPDDAVEPRLVRSADEAVELLESREVVGALRVPQPGTDAATLYTANAAGPSQATTVQQLLAPVAVQQGWTIESEDVAPLNPGDSSGTAVLFAAMGMMLAGYVPLSVILLGLPQLLAVRRFVPVLLGWAAGTSALIWLILGPIVGAVDGHFLGFFGVGMLAIGAVGAAQLLFTKLMGPLAVLIGMLLYVVLGMPASGLALSVDVMPGFFSFLHGVLPLPAAGEALRSLVYFDGERLGRHLLTLTVWVVVALGLSLLKERASGLAVPGAPPVTDPDAPLPALAGGPLRSLRFRYVTAAAFPLSILVMVVGLMSFAMHEPTVRELPVAVVGSTEQQASQVADGLQSSLGSMVDVQVAGSVDAATDAVVDGEVVAAYVLPAGPGEDATLYTSAGAGVSQQSVVRAVFGQVAAGQQVPLTETDLTPLRDSDTMGSNSMYVGMAWIMAGFLIMAVFRGGAPELKRFRQFVPHLAGWSVGMAVWLWLLFDVVIGAVNGNAWQMIGFGAATIFAMAVVTGAFTRTLGLAAIVPVMVVLMLAGVPASGGGLSLYMVPEVFRGLSEVLPLPAAVDAARSLVYFDGAGVGRDLLVIAVWGVIGLLLNLVVDRWLRRREDGTGVPGPDGRPSPPGAANEDADRDGTDRTDADRLESAGVR
ncbi:MULTISPECIES: ABC transporter permease [unclassified Modestobacter]|uniref:ABC transporter permease n=1 Tax=unclassified Modestobacter TaxID=2643866 RepID=UPI0022AAE15F|nr:MULTISPECIES: ABC transporter permease [unclassified Modestobacter]MCZ2825865.1 ABC transporter permease [Modestobacter sp. VKM Ac-2981]MCZ2853070.1 ABC transporter permease [Modestobacter sp. VKM Ac-2982]